METVATTIPAPDSAEAIFRAVVEVAYSFTDPIAVDRKALRIEGRNLKTGLSSAQIPYRVTVTPVDEAASEISVEIDIEDQSDRQMKATDLLVAVFRDQTPREYAKLQSGTTAPVSSEIVPILPSIFDSLSPLRLAEFFKYAAIPTLVLGLIGIIVTISLFASANPTLRPSPWVVVLTLGGEVFTTVVAAGILIFFGYVLELLTDTRTAMGNSMTIDNMDPRG
ncbi:hypothetical protein [Ferrimicrobium sp.]|uniref:hypothetical protein n=1 Tax=Ferrimicrobium sp. TaxID=2926050 RepID=UPI0026344AAD|nr:hypothetical protein [Ferrimicrobium sp.]